MTLRSLLRRYDRKLRKYYKNQLKQGMQNTSAVWVCDNYPFLISALKTASGYLSQNGEKGLMPLFVLCKEFISGVKEVTERSIVTAFSGEKLTIKQADALMFLLFAAAAAVVSENSENEEAVISSVKALLKLREIDFSTVLNDVSRAERLLCEDPSGIYEKMSPSTKAQYRKAVIKGAKNEGTDECTYIGRILDTAEAEKGKHIGFYLPVSKNRKKQGAVFVVSEWVICSVFSLLLSYAASGHLWYSVLILLPVYAILKPFFDSLSSKLFPPGEILSLDEEKITRCDTLIAVSSVLPSAKKAGELYSHLAQLKSADSSEGVKVLLLLDMKNSKSPVNDADEADIKAVFRQIDRLNEKYGGGFSAAVRDRVYAPTEGEYTGFERKRGAINALMKYLRDKNCGVFSYIHGDIGELQKMKYVLALDSDTKMTFEVLKKLVAAAEHPMNAPVYNKEKARITEGYGIISPRVETSIASAGKTVFSGLFTGGGSVLYSPRVSERYTDMFGEGIFSGKGLINVDAFNEAVTDKFEENRILSHDILEGNILRTAFMSSSELTDSFPPSPWSYFTRLHRWIRGDVQNIKYIFRPLGKGVNAPFVSYLGKYQLFDNFRRAFTPAVSFFLLVLSVFMPFYTENLFMFISVLSVVSPFLASLISLFLRGGAGAFSSVYLSSDIPGGAKNVLRCVTSVGSLPEEAFISLDAVVRALFRSLVSGKRLLQWVPAADTENPGKRNLVYGLILPFVSASLLFIFGSPLHRLAAVFIFIFIPLGISDGIKKKYTERRPPSDKEADIIASFAAAQWRFFEENVTAEENRLPPDNIQETPVYKKARRTSPTNIGFYLVSVLAAADMSFITPDEMVKRLSDTLFSVERLPKYKGLLYNWYDTVKMEPLPPSFVSLVDCGNFLCCLVALKEGLQEYKEYSTEITSLCKRIEKIINDSDISILYDKTRRLFRIGADGDTGEMSPSHYDLYMSEARLTSYFACASRTVPASHWMSLGRNLRRQGSFVTALSWTGTLFEYFMPLLFMPSVRGSFQDEALKTALYLQKKRAAKKGHPYGISESGFFAVDNSLNYRYKAHGLKALALKREADEESVISPYSVFLTLPFDRKGAMKNLGKLSSLHTEGRYGFYEAVDFSPGRTEGEDYNIVRSYMSHHVGMSIVAAANTLYDNIFVKRFMSDEKMQSAKILLEEKLPSHPTVQKNPSEMLIRKIRKKNGPDKTEKYDMGQGEVSAFSNGDVTVFFDKYGRNRCLFAGSDIYRFSGRTKGLSVAVFENGETLSLLPSEECGVTLEENCVLTQKRGKNIKAVSSVCVHPSLNAVLVPVRITNNSDRKVSVKIMWYSEPLLLGFSEKERHPAFSDMFIKCELTKKGDAVAVKRKNSPSSPCVAFGLYGRQRCVFNLDREKVIRRKIDGKSIWDRLKSIDGCEIQGISPCVAVSTDIEIPSGKSEECVLAFAVGSNTQDALHTLSGVMASALPKISRGRTASFLTDPLTRSAVRDFIADAVFSSAVSENIIAVRSSLKGSTGDLWKTGVSGDIPVISVFPERSCSESMLRAFIRLHRRLRNSSLMTDMVFIFESKKDYGFSGDRELMKVIKEEGADGFIDSRGGIHILYAPSLSDESFNAVLAFSSAVYPDNGKRIPVSGLFEPDTAISEYDEEGENGFTRDGFIIGGKPSLPWCHTLSNRTFGTLVSDRSLGFTWAHNSGLNKLTRWSNDTMGDFRGERLFFEKDGRIYDVIDNSSVYYTPDYAEYRFEAEGFSVVTKVAVPERGNIKKLSVRVTDRDKNALRGRLFFCMFPFLGETEPKEDIIHIHKRKGFVAAYNPLNTDYKGVMALSSPDENAVFCNSTEEMFHGTDKRCIGILQKFVIENKKDFSFICVFGKNEKTAERLLSLPFREKKSLRVRFSTPYPFFDAFSSSLLYHQTRDTRLDARTGFYQCSGAWGYRDQLQDILPLIGRDNRRVRQVIFRMASAQFLSGDVLHWFHTAYRERLIYKGVRTRCSDDMLWLVYTVSRYVLETGDRDILRKKIPFVTGRELREDETEIYGEYVLSDRRESLFTHMLSAVSRGFTRGEHGLPLMGTGDWNDSFSSVGEDGKGESVWLGMFLRKTLQLFAKVCDSVNEKEISERLRIMSEEVTSAIEKNAWNGSWYIRGFYDDGSPLGDKGASSCEIDLLTAAWSVLGDMPDRKRRRTALMNAYDRLFDEENGVLRLFDPPFGENSKFTGYVNYYPEGVRENGGQYTHAAVWFTLALFEEGCYSEGERVLRALIPSEKYRDGKGDIYKTEPYALAGDVYSSKGREGRGGWSLYTGSAGWMLQLGDKLSELKRTGRINTDIF